MKDLIFFFLNRYVLLNSFKVIKELIVTTLSLFFSFISSCFSSDRITELIWRLFLLKPDHHLLEWRNRGLFETNAFGNTYTVLRLSHIFSLSYKRLFQALSENGENLIMRWKLFGISMLTMKILFMELLNTQIMSKINSLLDKIIDQGKRSNIIRSFFIYNGLFLLCIYWKRGKKLRCNCFCHLPTCFQTTHGFPSSGLHFGSIQKVWSVRQCWRCGQKISSSQQPLSSCNESCEAPLEKEGKSM